MRFLNARLHGFIMDTACLFMLTLTFDYCDGLVRIPNEKIKFRRIRQLRELHSSILYLKRYYYTAVSETVYSGSTGEYTSGAT